MTHISVFFVFCKRTYKYKIRNFWVEYKDVNRRTIACNLSCVTVYVMALRDVRGQALFQKNQTLDKLL